MNKPIDSFTSCTVFTEKGKITKLRDVCYDCNYKKANRRGFLWEKATDKEKLKWVEKQFNKMVVKKGREECWDWKGFVRPDGYTRIKFGSRTTSVGGHVVSWMIKHQRIIKDGECILHKCDNRKCTNPRHLYLGTYSDNMIDMVNRKRNQVIKLHVSDVKKIKESISAGDTVASLARRFKVNWSTIYDIKHERTWKHVKI
jgi:hypothetical protein